MTQVKSSGADVQSAIQIIKGVLDRESGALRKLLNETEKFTRETVNAEVEAKNNIVSQKTLQNEISKLKASITAAGREKDKTAAALANAKAKCQGLDKEDAGLKKDVGDLQTAVAKLNSENNSLKSEVAKLESKETKLSADVTRLKNLRAKYLAEIAEFRSS
ncbi:hypothetical protein ACFL4W_01795 [Planctomycetota bacterium]